MKEIAEKAIDKKVVKSDGKNLEKGTDILVFPFIGVSRAVITDDLEIYGIRKSIPILGPGSLYEYDCMKEFEPSNTVYIRENMTVFVPIN